MRFGHGVGDSTVTYTAFAPPHRWAGTSSAPRLDVRLDGAVRAAATGSRLAVRTTLLPHGPLRPLTPLLRRYIHRTWDHDLAAIKAQLEEPRRGDPDARGRRLREPVRQHP